MDDVGEVDNRQVAILLKGRLVPKPYHWLYMRCDDALRIHLPSVLDDLCNERIIDCCGAENWRLGVGALDERAGFDKSILIGPIWEPMFAAKLREAGLPVEQQRHECGYYLDIALVAEDGAKLDVEVDGRQHRMLRSQRVKDLVRDARLRANGWRVVRIPVPEIMKNVDARVAEVGEIWHNLLMKGERL